MPLVGLQAELGEYPADMNLHGALGRNRLAAISLLDMPSATRAKTSCSRLVRACRIWAPPTGPLNLGGASNRAVGRAGQRRTGGELADEAAGGARRQHGAAASMVWMAATRLPAPVLEQGAAGACAQAARASLVKVEGGQGGPDGSKAQERSGRVSRVPDRRPEGPLILAAFPARQASRAAAARRPGQSARSRTRPGARIRPTGSAHARWSAGCPTGPRRRWTAGRARTP